MFMAVTDVVLLASRASDFDLAGTWTGKLPYAM
jgi:hypothetical protein